MSLFCVYLTVFPISHVPFLLLQGVTNYLHLIGAGHLLCYQLKLYGNLYRFSQQGWEALNKLIKSQYHCKSNHGGCLGNHNSAMIRGRQLLSTANLLTRRFCWLTRIGQEFFQGMEQCMPCIPEEPVQDLQEPEQETAGENTGESTGLRAYFLETGNPMAVI